MVITEFEKQAGVVALDEKLLPKVKTFEEFAKYVDEHRGDFHGVMYDDRVAFLEANDYEVTRENLINWELSHKPPIDHKKTKRFGFLRRK